MDEDVKRSTKESPDQEPTADAAYAVPVVPTKAKLSRRSFSSARRELTDTELASPAVQKLLLDEIDRLEAQNSELIGFQQRFHEADKKVAILDAKRNLSIAHEAISLACVTVGAAALGYAPSLWSRQPDGYVSLVFGTTLVCVGIFAKAKAQ